MHKLPRSWTIARHGLYNMPNTSSPTLPASCRKMLAAPPDFSSCTRCSGSRTTCANTRLRTDSCSVLVTRVACQRPQM